MVATFPLPSSLAVALVTLYQRHVSPRKGFSCAMRVARRRRQSCSAFAKRVLARFGALPGVQLIRRRFAKCRAAKRVLDSEARQPGKAASDRRTASCADWGREAGAQACDCGLNGAFELAGDACCAAAAP